MRLHSLIEKKTNESTYKESTDIEFDMGSIDDIKVGDIENPFSGHLFRFCGAVTSAPNIQLNDDFADVKDIASFIAQERASKREELIPFLTTALKVDSDANMGLIGDIKQELRKVNALKLNYTTKKGSVFGRD